jgi:hypothetical protein
LGDGKGTRKFVGLITKYLLPPKISDTPDLKITSLNEFQKIKIKCEWGISPEEDEDERQRAKEKWKKRRSFVCWCKSNQLASSQKFSQKWLHSSIPFLFIPFIPFLSPILMQINRSMCLGGDKDDLRWRGRRWTN